MTRERRNPFGIHETEEGKRLLGEIREKLRQQGLGIAQFHQHGNDELIQFDIMQGLWVYNHGERQIDIQCMVYFRGTCLETAISRNYSFFRIWQTFLHGLKNFCRMT